MKRYAAALLLCFCSTLAVADTTDIRFFRVLLSPANEVPAANFPGGGAGTLITYVTKDDSGNITSGSMDFNVGVFIGAPASITGMNVYRGAAGSTGPMVILTDLGTPQPMAVSPGLSILAKQAEILPTDTVGVAALNALFNDATQFYLNVRTTDFPGGLLRGQLNATRFQVPLALMTPDKVVPPVTGSSASALGQSIVVAAQDASGAPTSGTIVLDAVFSFKRQTTITGFHLHKGPAGSNGPIVFSAGLEQTGAIPTAADGTGHIRQFLEPDMTNALQRGALTELFSNTRAYYLDLHTAEFPDGEVREQVNASEGVRRQVPLSAANVVPAVNLSATGPSMLLVRTIRNEDGSVKAGSMMFIANYRFPGATAFTGLDVHDGAAGTNGPATIRASVNPAAPIVSPFGFGNIFDFTGVYDPAGLATLNTIVQSPENVYLEMHTTANPDGAVRAQLGPTITALPEVAGASNSADGSAAAPGALISIYGTNLSKVASDLLPWFGQNLPRTYNGTSVTIGGKQAPILYVSPTQINAQVPLDVPAGTQPIVVTNSNGAGATFNAPISPVAPAIFRTAPETGAVVHQDFSLVTSTSPAGAGDVLIIYATGLGQTTPPLTTGALVAFPPQSDTAAVTVTIGGKTANVIYSIAAPNSVGLYQVAVTMPSGVAAGTASLVLSMGTAASSPVNIATH